MDITPLFNELLRKHNAPPVTEKKLSLEAIDGFLKEAYRINSHITTLHKELKDVRQAYLSTAQPRRHVRTNTGSSSLKEAQKQPLTDRQREDIDARAKSMLRELNASIRALDETEQLRRETEAAVIRKTHVRGLGALSAWAAGAEVADARKSAEHLAAEGKARDVGLHRDGVLWSLRQALQLCGRTQQDMMEARLTREMKKNRSVLAKAGGGGAMPELGGGFYEAMKREKQAKKGGFSTATGLPPDEGSYDFRQDLTEEQIQMFEKGNQDMLQHYNSTLDKVRTAEKSLIEIAELQTLLVGNLATQSAHIEQLVSDSENITADVGGGNKQLKKATQRPSAARYTFFASAGLCAFLILWDLVI